IMGRTFYRLGLHDVCGLFRATAIPEKIWKHDALVFRMGGEVWLLDPTFLQFCFWPRLRSCPAGADGKSSVRPAVFMTRHVSRESMDALLSRGFIRLDEVFAHYYLASFCKDRSPAFSSPEESMHHLSGLSWNTDSRDLITLYVTSHAMSLDTRFLLSCSSGPSYQTARPA
nr:hypothetical protein [Pseudomonadota bacterium]